MSAYVQYVALWVALLCCLTTTSSKSPASMSTSDYMMRIQCQARCLTTTPMELETDDCDYEKCFEELKISKKLGSCPKRTSRETAKNDTMVYILTSNCIDQCGEWDFNCPEAEKCCPTSCGSTCHRPMDLDRIKALPTVPHIHSVTESRYRSIEICWDIYTEIKNKTLFFVISGRSHVGSLFASHKLSDWTIFNGSPRYDHIFRENSRETARRWCFILKIKPGRWYQFRVASVNENGTRGFSKHSTEIQLKDIKSNKFPKPPRDLVIGPLHIDRSNSSLLSATLSWNQPKTHIPVDKYKIFWSRHLPGVINSVSMQQATVLEPQRYFQFRHLAPDSMYFIQVQSISVFGHKRLRSKKESRSLNTTIENHHLHVRHLSKSNFHLLVRFLISKSHELVVKVHWQQHQSNESYYQLELCHGPINCLDKVGIGEYRAVNTTRNSFEFLDLSFNTVYSVRLKFNHKWSISEPRSAHRTFKTPDCSTLKHKHNIKLLDCTNK